MNGGTAGTGEYPTLIAKGAVLAKPSPDPSKADNTFGGWYADTGLTQTYNFANPVTANLNLYAKWEATVAHTHQWGAWTVTTAATCSATGVGVRYCTECNEQDSNTTIPINPDAHQLDPSYIITQPTCTLAGSGAVVCLLNNAHSNPNQVVVFPALGHLYGSWTETTAPTCTATGIDTRTCSRDLTHNEIRTVAINPDAHDWNSDYTTITAATETTDGLEVITCKHNNTHTKEARTLYAIGTAGLAFELSNNTAYRVRKGLVSSGVVHIPAYYRPNATSAYLPITEIGSASDYDDGAFEGTTISAVHIPETVKSIGSYAFFDCTSLASASIGAGVMSIGDGAFNSCTSLASITLPAGVTAIGSNAFFNCTGLATVTFAEGFSMSIGDWFRYSSIITVNIPASVTAISGSAFVDCTSLTRVTFAEGSQLQSIGSNAFNNCTSLTGITIPTGVTSISYGAFAGCTSLTEITIPASVTSISQSAFFGWTSSQTITVQGKANQTIADAAWGSGWRSNCNAKINYVGGYYSASI